MEKEKKYHIGYALSGGGVKGFAHAGALRALEEYHIKPDIISGTSAGSVVAALYSAGRSPFEICEIFKSKGFTNFATIIVPKSGFFNPSKFMDFLEENVGYTNIEDLPVPIRVVASDLDNGKSVVFDRGLLKERVMASASVPIVFVPTEIDGVHYVDGGVFKNFPVSTIREDCDIVIGINVSPLVPDKYNLNIMEIADRAYNFMFRANTFEDRRSCDVLVEVADALKYSTFDLSNTEDLFDMGYQAMSHQLEKPSVRKILGLP